MKPGVINVLLARQPLIGQVKTSLIPHLGPGATRRLAEAFLKDTIASVRKTDLPFAVAYSPGNAEPYFRELVPWAFRFFPQRGTNLGEKMGHAFRTMTDEGYGKILLIRSAAPLLTPEILKSAAAALDTNPVVIGPTRGGGHYLLGLSRFLPELFSSVDWGSGQILKRTLSIIRLTGRSPHLLPELFDIDRPEDLLDLARTLKAGSVRAKELPLRTLREIRRVEGIIGRSR